MPKHPNSAISIKRRNRMIAVLNLPVDASDSDIITAFVADEMKYRAAMFGIFFSECVLRQAVRSDTQNDF